LGSQPSWIRVWRRSRGHEQATNFVDDHIRRSTYGEVPDPENLPASSPKFGVYAPVACHIALDLAVPVVAGASGLVPGRMTVPEGSIDEYRGPQARPGDVRSSRCASIVAAPSTQAGSIQR
jgi:hypothetical protein